MEIGGVALRDIVLALVGAIGIYVAIMVLRLVQIGRHKRLASDFEPVAPSLGEDEPEAPAPLREEETPRFGAELARSQSEQEARQLREEVGRLREELATLRRELADVQAARHVSPQYADAMALVQRGLTAQDVADRCNISLGEAELVWALAHGPTNFEQEDDYGRESGRNQARAA